MCVDAAEALLFNKGGKFLGEDEAFFIDQLVIYGDTRGCKKFIDRQYKLIGALVEGIAQHIMDIGYFIKTNSNCFYKFKLDHKEYSLVGLLDLIKIESISSNISRYLRNYNVNKNKPCKNVELERTKCLANIDSVITTTAGTPNFVRLSGVSTSRLNTL